MHLLGSFKQRAGEENGTSCGGVDFCPLGANFSQPDLPLRLLLAASRAGGMAPGAAPQKCHRILLPASDIRGCPRSSLLPVTEAKVVIDRVSGWIRNNRCMGSDCCFCLSFTSRFRWSGNALQGIYLRVQLFCISPLVIKSQAV